MKSWSVSSFSLIPCRPPFRFQFSVFNFQLPPPSTSRPYRLTPHPNSQNLSAQRYYIFIIFLLKW